MCAVMSPVSVIEHAHLAVCQRGGTSNSNLHTTRRARLLWTGSSHLANVCHDVSTIRKSDANLSVVQTSRCQCSGVLESFVYQCRGRPPEEQSPREKPASASPGMSAARRPVVCQEKLAGGNAVPSELKRHLESHGLF